MSQHDDPSTLSSPLLPLPKFEYAWTGLPGLLARRSTYNLLGARRAHGDVRLKAMRAFELRRRDRFRALVDAGLPLSSQSTLKKRLLCTPAGVKVSKSVRECNWSACPHCHVRGIYSLYSRVASTLFLPGDTAAPGVRLVLTHVRRPVTTPYALRRELTDYVGRRFNAVRRLNSVGTFDCATVQADRDGCFFDRRRLSVYWSDRPDPRSRESSETTTRWSIVTPKAFAVALSAAYPFATVMQLGPIPLALEYAAILAKPTRLVASTGRFRCSSNPSVSVSDGDETYATEF